MYSGFPSLGYSNIIMPLRQPQIPHELPWDLARARGELVLINSSLMFNAKYKLKLYLYVLLCHLNLQVCCRRWANTLIC
jgi:hypothetical protein